MLHSFLYQFPSSNCLRAKHGLARCHIKAQMSNHSNLLRSSNFEPLLHQYDGDTAIILLISLTFVSQKYDAVFRQMLVAIGSSWWTTANPNLDPLCQSVCVTVSYNGKSITVPVKDKCPSCDSNHLDLSLPAFRQLANPDIGHVYGAKFKFVHC